MFRFDSLDIDTPKCRIVFRFVGTDGAVQLFSMTSNTRSWEMLFRPSWADLCSLSVIKIVPYFPDSELFGACLILTLDNLFLEMAVGSSDSRGPSGLVRHSCSSA